MKSIRTRDRKSVRLKGHDYAAAGKYFVTICTYNRDCIFGNVIDGTMHLSAAGRILNEEWLKTSDIRPGIELDVFVIMPDHFHAIIIIKDESKIPDVGTHSCASTKTT
jgi:REP element-mobilizing transposase RayT